MKLHYNKTNLEYSLFLEKHNKHVQEFFSSYLRDVQSSNEPTIVDDEKDKILQVIPYKDLILFLQASAEIVIGDST